MPTLKLNLPTIDNTKTADVVRDMNALANAVDTAAGTAGGLATLDPDGKVPSSQLSISAPPDASTTQKGIVMLEDSTTSTSVTKAATPKSVKAVADQVGTLTTLNTTAKSNLVAAVNELFTFANDGKAKWSNVVGSPLASSDTFTQMQTKTQTIKNTLATNLTAKGQSSVGTETLAVLVDKVSNVNVGRASAIGSVTSSLSKNIFPIGLNGAATSSAYASVTVTGLGFMPSIIHLFNINGSLVDTAVYTSDASQSYPKTVNNSTYYNDRNVNNNTFAYRADVSPLSVTNTGFTLPVTNTSRTYKWIAIE